MATDAFEKFKTGINKSVATVSVKTSSALEKIKIKTHINTLQSEIQEVKLAAGEKTFNSWRNKEFTIALIEPELVLIEQKYSEIDLLTAKLDGIDDRDKEILGGKVAEVAVEKTKEPQFICPNCGHIYDSSLKFCRKCGTKMPDLQTAENSSQVR